MKIAVVYYSGQEHTHEVALAVAEGLRKVPSAEVAMVRLLDEHIQGGRWKHEQSLATVNQSDCIVFGTPTYMAGYSAQMKCFIDACGGIWFQQGWVDKMAAGFTHSQGLSGDKLNTLNGLMLNAMQHGMMWVGTGMMPEGSSPGQLNRLSSFTGLMAQSDYGQAHPGEGDLKTARLCGERVAKATQRWLAGRQTE